MGFWYFTGCEYILSLMKYNIQTATKLFKILNNRILFHILFWLSYVLFFGMVYGKYGNNYGWYLLETTCMLPFIMFATYMTIYVYLPFYIRKRRIIPALFLLFLTLFIATLGERVFIRTLNSLEVTFDSMFDVAYVYLLLETSLMVGSAIAIKMTKKWFEQQNEKHEAEKKNLLNELNQLKAQLQPHFLFNTLNNLYTLSLEKSSKTSEGIAKIADLLRSVLYECNDAEIDLEKEISLITNFIELEKMRYNNRLIVDFEVNGDVESYRIAPMLLFTFVENCFKHGSSNDSGNPWIKIVLTVGNGDIEFKAHNSIPKKNPDTTEEVITNIKEGIGLSNVKRRLKLLYPGRNKLIFKEGHESFLAVLRIQHARHE